MELCSRIQMSNSFRRIQIRKIIMLVDAKKNNALIEPGGITLSAAFQDQLDGPRELAIEVGDRVGSPLCLNITDGAAEALSKLKEWNKASSEGEQLDSPLFPEDAYSTITTNGTDDSESLHLNHQAATEAHRFVARKAALSFA
jgi:hypothetical protein